MDLKGRHALVTGAGSSIGRAIAWELAAAGAKVAIGDVDITAASAVAAEIGGVAILLDVRDEAMWEAAIDVTIGNLGGFDILVNNAGIERSALLVDMEVADAGAILDVNVIGTMLGIKHGLRAMRSGGLAGMGGSIVNLASAAAVTAPIALGLYAASKAAVERLTKVAAVEAGLAQPAVRVNLVLPGIVAASGMADKLTAEMVAMGMAANTQAIADSHNSRSPMGRFATKEEVARAVRWLCSEDAGFVNGVGITVDGGTALV